jgi:predicted nucleic acid-binding protein
VLVYAATARKSEPAKWEVAHELLEQQDAAISGQVLAEFYVTVLRKRYLDERDAAFWLERLSLMPMVAVDASLVMAGAALSRRYQISYWDGAIVAAAERLGMDLVYSEDLNHGQLYGAVRVLNPFLEI